MNHNNIDYQDQLKDLKFSLKESQADLEMYQGFLVDTLTELRGWKRRINDTLATIEKTKLSISDLQKEYGVNDE